MMIEFENYLIEPKHVKFVEYCERVVAEDIKNYGPGFIKFHFGDTYLSIYAKTIEELRLKKKTIYDLIKGDDYVSKN